jgi:hypothetical protein
LVKTLEQENPSWKLPERRVSKFLKKELKTNGVPLPDDLVGTNDDDDDVSVASTNNMMKKAGASLRSLFSNKEEVVPTTIETKGFFRSPLKSFWNKKQEKKKELTEIQPEATVVEPGHDVNEIVKEASSPPLLQVSPEEPEGDVQPPESAPFNKDVLYDDENDGKHEPALCGGCLIL